jgi:hypothetical protein
VNGLRTRAFVVASAVAGPAWLRWARRRYRRLARPLSEGERERMAPFFSSALLDVVRVAQAGEVELPLMGLARRLSGGRMPLERVGGIALIDTVVIARPDENLGTLFHELVHIAQYRRLGVGRFLREYVGGWAAAGCSYPDIPLEVQACELQSRYIAHPRDGFSVEGEVELFCREIRRS